MIDRVDLIKKIKEMAIDLSMYYGDNIEVKITVNKIMKNTDINITIKNI